MWVRGSQAGQVQQCGSVAASQARCSSVGPWQPARPGAAVTYLLALDQTSWWTSELLLYFPACRGGHTHLRNDKWFSINIHT